MMAGVTPGMIVPLCFEKSKWTVVAVLGVLKAGAAFVFLDAETQPEARLRAIVEQANATVICSSVQNQDLSQTFRAAVVVVGPGSLAEASATLPPVDPTSPLYLNFTSGSTGQPKGAVVSHRSMASALYYQLEPLRITRETRLYDFASYSFDVAIHNVLATLSAGGCLCVPSDMDRKTRLAESMEEMQTNYIDLTASVSRLLDPQDVPTLKTLTLGGEPVSQDDAERWWGKVHLINSCGPSECTPMSVINTSPDSPAALRRIGLGTGMLTWVVDPADHHRLLHVGQVGELILEGPLLGSGYLNDPVRTAATFIDAPRWLLDHRRQPNQVYKTGDLVQYQPDGTLHIVGRKDTQVKVRGQRVELEEVEHHLRRLLPDDASVVAEAVAMKPSAALVAFVCFNSQATSTSAAVDDNELPNIASMATELEEKLPSRLPPYMVPSLYVPLVAMPMTATGKTNRKDLRALVSTLSREQLDLMRGLPANKQAHRPPVTALERRFQKLWAQALQLPEERVGLDDSFIALGGDSITAMQVVGEARKRVLEFSVADIFRERTIANLIQNSVSVPDDNHFMSNFSAPPQPYNLVDHSVKQGVLAITADSTNVQDVFPTTDFQAMTIVQPCNYFYLDLETTRIDEGRLRSSCQSLFDHYPLLRSTFVRFEGQYWQVVPHRAPPVSLTTFDSEDPLDQACSEVCAQDLGHGVSLNEQNTKFFLVHSDHGSLQTPVSRLILRLSHAQYDGISLPVMVQKLAELYQDHEQQNSLSSLDSFPQYLAHLLRQRAQSHVYWTRHLAGVSNTPITFALSRTLTGSISTEPQTGRKTRAKGMVTLQHLPEDLPQSTLIGSAWAMLLSFITGHDDIIFGHLVANRDISIPGGSGHDIIGPCVNIVPVRVKVNMPSKQTTTTADPRAVPQSIHNQLLSLRETGLMMGWEDIIRSCTDWHKNTTVPNGGSASPILESIVQHQNINEHPEIQFAGTTAKLHWYENQDALPPVPFGVASHPIDGGSSLKIQVLSSTQFVTEEMVKRLVGYLCEIVRMLVSHGTDGNEDAVAWQRLSVAVRADFGTV